MSSRLIIIIGGSGVGKSTLARALQEELLPNQWLHFSVDTIFYCLPRSIVAQVDQMNDRTLVDSKAIVTAAYECAGTLLSLGHRVIFDTVVISQTGAQNLLRAFDGLEPLIVQLSCSWEEIRGRTLVRGDRTLEEAEHGLKNAGPHLVAHLTFDTTSTSANSIAQQLAVRVRP